MVRAFRIDHTFTKYISLFENIDFIDFPHSWRITKKCFQIWNWNCDNYVCMCMCVAGAIAHCTSPINLFTFNGKNVFLSLFSTYPNPHLQNTCAHSLHNGDNDTVKLLSACNIQCHFTFLVRSFNVINLTSAKCYKELTMFRVFHLCCCCCIILCKVTSRVARFKLFHCEGCFQHE